VPPDQPSLRDWWPCASTPALKRRAIFGLSRWDEENGRCQKQFGMDELSKGSLNSEYMNAWKPDANQIAKIKQLVEIALPQCRPTIVGLNCDASLLQAVANETTNNLLLADGLPKPTEPQNSDSLNRIHGDYSKIISALEKLQFQADLLVLTSFAELPMAIQFCSRLGEGILLVESRELENLAAAPDDTAKYIWGRINLDGTNSIKDGITAIFFAWSHAIGRSPYIKTIKDLAEFRSNRREAESPAELSQNERTVKQWNAVKRFYSNKLSPFVLHDHEREANSDYSIILGPGIVKYFSVGYFLRNSADDAVSVLKSFSKEFTLKVPDINFGMEVLQRRLERQNTLIGNFQGCAVNIMDVDYFLAVEDWERRLRTHHAFCHFCFSHAMPSMVYACFHEWLELDEFSFEECLKAWIKDGGRSETFLESYRFSPDHAVVRRGNRNSFVFEKTPFVREMLAAKETAAINKITAEEVERIRKSRFDCYIYVMEDLRNNSFKIGKSKTPGKRERTLQSEVPQIVMRLSIPAEEVHEKNLHEHFEEKRIRGEWFALKSQDLVWLVSYLKSHGDISRASVDFSWLGSIHFHIPTTGEGS
jgi:hypothetical protein